MTQPTMTIWCNSRFPQEVAAHLRAGTTPHRLIISDKAQASNLVPGEADPALADADIVFGQPDPDALEDVPRLRWIHLNSAGYTRYDTAAFRAFARERGLRLTNSSTVYAEPCAQHAAAFIYAQARQLPRSMRSQLTDREWQDSHIRRGSFLLGGKTVLIYGFGAIGRRLVELLAPLGMNITAVRRSPVGDEPVAITDASGADALLGEAEIVINLLPSNPTADGFFDAARIARFKRGATFVNIGRGSTVDQDALLAALNDGRLGAALLDVTTPEPLPPDHPLWSHPDCVITPHAAGGFAGEQQVVVQHFLNNLRRYERGDVLLDRVM